MNSKDCMFLGCVHYGFSVCMHIINTCAVWQRCESESFSTKWSAGRERNKEMCSCQGSSRLRLLPEIFWKNHTFEGLVLCCLRISSSDQWNKKGTGVGEFWCLDGHGTGDFGRHDTSLYLSLHKMWNRQYNCGSLNMYCTIKETMSLKISLYVHVGVSEV